MTRRESEHKLALLVMEIIEHDPNALHVSLQMLRATSRMNS